MFSYVICRFGNVCTIEADGMCPECVAYFDLFGYSAEDDLIGDFANGG